MSAVLLFIVLTAALTLVVVAVLLRPWARLPARASERTSESAPAGLEIYRSQWQALARDRAAGLLSAEDFDPAREDLRRRVLAEINETDEMDATAATAVGAAPDAASRGLSGRSAWALAAAMPLAAVLIYVGIGNPQALTPPPAARQDTAALARRVAQLKANPGDAEGWLALARAYEVLGRFPEAAEAFEKGRARVDGDPALLAAYDRRHQLNTRPLYHGTNAIVKLFTRETPPAKLLRHGVLRLSQALPPLKHLITRQLTG